jgi:hypothetical protein
MSVESLIRKQQFTLDGIEDEYTFTFRALTSAPEDIKCSVKTAGTTTVLTYTTQYSVSINSDGLGGTITLVSASTIGLGTLTVYRETTNTQESDYDDYNQFPANTLENDLDIRTMVDQEQSETFERTVKLPIESTLTDIVLPEPEAGKALGWNGAGTQLENISLLDLSAETIIRGNFTYTNISSGTLTITHNKGNIAVSLIMIKNTGEKISPSYTCYNNYIVVTLTPWGVISGTWKYSVI